MVKSLELVDVTLIGAAKKPNMWLELFNENKGSH
jgi:hypothetical protein